MAVFWREAMTLAVEAAHEAARANDVPVGAVLLDRQNNIVTIASNRRERDRNPLAHAEILCLQAASIALQRWRFDDCTLLCTLEPCLMCTGAILQTKVAYLVFGAFNLKDGIFSNSNFTLSPAYFNSGLEVIGGFEVTKCQEVLQLFFKTHRNDKKKP